MSQNQSKDQAQEPAAPATPPPVDTTADIEAQRRDAESQYLEQRRRHINQLRNRGYTSGTEKRVVRSTAHGEFLIRAGEPGCQP